MPPRDPALRPYRFAAWTGYITFSAICASLLIRAVAIDLWGPGLPAHKGPATVSRCLGDLERLYSELNAELWSASGRGSTPAEAAASFNAWTRRWERDLEAVEHACAGTAGEPGRAALADAAARLNELRGTYVTHMERFAAEGGPEAAQTRAALDLARTEIKQKR